MKILKIAWVAFRELVYERSFYLLLAFVAFAIGISFLMGQLTFAEQYKLTIDFLLAGSQISLVLFSVFVGISLLQKEIATGSVSMVLSKPISRTTFILGKFVGQSLMQGLVCAFMWGVTLIACSYFKKPHLVAITQNFFLVYCEITILTAITYFFAVNTSAITTAAGALGLFAVGHFSSTISQSMRGGGLAQTLWSYAKNLIPNLEVFNVKGLAAYGLAVTSAEVGWATIYAVVCIIAYLTAASLTFAKKDILT